MKRAYRNPATHDRRETTPSGNHYLGRVAPPRVYQMPRPQPRRPWWKRLLGLR